MLGRMEAPERPLAPILAMLAAIAFWGGSFTATKAAVAEVPPVAFALARFGLATAVMLGAQAVTRTPLRVPRGLWGLVVWVALLGTTATYVLENIALKYTTSGNGSLLIALAVLHGRLTAEQAWAAAHVDETFQASVWGSDAEAEARLVTPIARRTILGDDALSVLVPILEDVVGYDRAEVRDFFARNGLVIAEWDRVRTDRLRIDATA